MKYLPNLLSLLRIALTPVVCTFVLEMHLELALWFTLAAGLTDAADGFLARRFRASSKLGSYLDPIADKILLVAVFLSLAVVNVIPVWLVEIVFVRDLLLLAGTGLALAFTRLRQFEPTALGKVSTAVQVATALAAMLAESGRAPALRPLVLGLFWLTAALAVASGLHYYWRGARRIADL